MGKQNNFKPRNCGFFVFGLECGLVLNRVTLTELTITMTDESINIAQLRSNNRMQPLSTSAKSKSFSYIFFTMYFTKKRKIKYYHKGTRGWCDTFNGVKQSYGANIRNVFKGDDKEKDEQ